MYTVYVKGSLAPDFRKPAHAYFNGFILRKHGFTPLPVLYQSFNRLNACLSVCRRLGSRDNMEQSVPTSSRKCPKPDERTSSVG